MELFFLIEFKSARARVYEVQILMVMKELRLRFTRKFFFFCKAEFMAGFKCFKCKCMLFKKDAIFYSASTFFE